MLRQPEQVRRIIGCVSQRSAADLEATGWENLTLQGQLYGLSGSELRRRASDLLERFGLADAAGRLTSTWSGGMQRKLSVAMGLINHPQVLFLDEPTTGLDPQARAEMWAEIDRLAGQEGMAILLTSHYLDEADHLARRLAIVDRGRVVVEGSPEQLKRELHGDAVLVELATDAAVGRVRDALAGLDGTLRDVAIDGRSVHMRVERGATAVPAILAALEAAGLGGESVTISRPSLDDVYLRYAGRSFARAHEEGTR